MIETINIWKRSHDGRFGICILCKSVKVKGHEILDRHKLNVASLEDAIESITHFKEYGEFPNRFVKESENEALQNTQSNGKKIEATQNKES